MVPHADAQMRMSRRSAFEDNFGGYTDCSPWSAVFMAATKDHEFWSRELGTPATPTKKPKKTGTRAARRGYR